MEETNVIKRVAKNTSWLFISEIISKGFAFILTVAIARYLGVKDFGIYSFVFAFVALFAVLPDFGFTTLAIREIASDNSQIRKYLENINTVKLFISLFTFSVIATTINFTDKPSNVIILVYLASIYTIIDSFSQFFKSVFRAFEKMEYEGIIKIIRGIVLLFLGILVILTNLGLEGFVFAYILASIVDFCMTIFLIKRHFTDFGFSIDIPFCKSILKESSFYFLSAVLMTLYFRINITMLSLLAGDQAVGLYSSSYNIIIFMNIIPSVFLPSLFPIFSRNHTKSPEDIKRLYGISLKYLFIISICITTILIIFSKQIISAVYGDAFLNATASFNMLVLVGGIMIFDRIGIDLLNATKRQKLNTIIIGICAIINILSSLLFIPLWKEIGAAMSTLLTEIVLLALILIFTKEYMSFKYILSFKNDQVLAHIFFKRLYKFK